MLDHSDTASCNQKPASGRIPFVLSLPQDGETHHEFLDVKQGVTMRSGLVTLHAGQDVGSHSTGNHEEMLVILGGVGEVEVEGAGRRRIREGMVAYIPPHTEHNVFNIEDFPLRYIYIVARAE